MDPVALRTFVYQELVTTGSPPKAAEIGSRFGASETDVKAALASLKIGKTIAVHPATGEIWMCGPFSAVPTAYRVTRGATQWFANCAWDMLGIPFIVGQRVHIETSCADCGEAMTLDGGPDAPPALQAMVHILVPAKHWYEDLAFT